MIFAKILKQKPTVKKAADLINKKSHEEKKYISLMLVPSYSDGKTRTLSIPRTVFYGITAFIAFIFLMVGAFYLRGVHFQSVSLRLNYTLAETEETFEMFVQTAEEQHIALLGDTIDMYELLSTQSLRAQNEFERLERRHQNDFDVLQNLVSDMEGQVISFENERLALLEFLAERADFIPPISDNVEQINISQEILISEFNYTNGNGAYVPTEDGEPVRAAVGLMSGRQSFDPVTEAELMERLQVLAVELDFQIQLFESIENYKSEIDVYLRNFPTLMPIDDGRITSWFGNRRDPIHGRTSFHEGVDIPAPLGTPIRAAGGGVVVFEGWRGAYGNLVIIDHGGGLSTRYAHNSRNLVYEGQVVERGEVIAYVGSTGRSLSPHLHYEVWRGGRPINPVPFINEPFYGEMPDIGTQPQAAQESPAISTVTYYAPNTTPYAYRLEEFQ